MDLSLFSFALVLVSLLAFPTYQQELIHKNGQKSLHITLYVHETLNKTAYFIVKGVAGPKAITKETTPFGSLFAFQDPLTETPDRNAKVIGYLEGSGVTSSFDGERATYIARASLNFKGYKGELINVGTAHNTQGSVLPCVGGTGDFSFVQGFMTTSVVDLSGPTVTYKLDFDLFWPPYVPRRRNAMY